MANTVRTIAKAVKNADRNKTNPYTANATVKRVDGNTAWVHIDGGIDETPVIMAVKAKAGDKVRVRVAGGKAYLTGNTSAPPTDDTKAESVEVQTNAVRKDLEAQKEYFYHDDAGAHVAGGKGYRTDLRSDGMRVVKTADETIVAKFGRETYIASDDGTELAHFGYDDGNTEGGGTAVAPYYTLGRRATGSEVGNYSLSEGSNTIASGYASHAEGGWSNATDSYSHAEGANVYSEGFASHAEGRGTHAVGDYSHAEGAYCWAEGTSSHAGGINSYAEGAYAFAHGYYATAPNDYQFAVGKFNEGSTSNLFEVGNGTNNNNRTNAMEVTSTGRLNVTGGYYVDDNPLITVAEVSGAATITANSTAVYSVDCQKDDYTPVGVVGYDLDGTNIRYLRVLAVAKSNTAEEIYFQIRNDYSSDISSTLKAKVLYVANQL